MNRTRTNNSDPDDCLVCLATFTTATEADVARVHLAHRGIRSRLSGAAVVTWFWHYSVAVGGVGLDVRRGDFHAADEAFWPDEETRLPSTLCESCGEIIEPGWDICWKCGHDRENQLVVLTEEDESPDHGQQHDVALLGLFSILAGVLYLAGGAESLVYPASFAAYVIYRLVCLALPSVSAQPPTESEENATDTAPPTAKWEDLVDDYVGRVVRAAFFGWVWFPPLAWYSLYLVWRLSTSSIRLTASQRWKIFCANVVGGIASLPLFGFAALLGLGLFFDLGEVAFTLARYLEALFDAHSPETQLPLH